MPQLSSRFDDALNYAHEVHRGQNRKGTGAPYIGHLLGVASIVLDDGGSEDEAIGALLHDLLQARGINPAGIRVVGIGLQAARLREGALDGLDIRVRLLAASDQRQNWG